MSDPFGVLEAKALYDAALRARDETIRDLWREGVDLRSIAPMVGLTFQRVGQIVGKRSNEWGPVPVQARRATTLDDYRAAKAAQQEREETHTMGYATETRGFYGDQSVSAAAHSEDKLTLRVWLEQSRQENSA